LTRSPSDWKFGVMNTSLALLGAVRTPLDFTLYGFGALYRARIMHRAPESNGGY
jgi:hypothetical protein